MRPNPHGIVLIDVKGPHMPGRETVLRSESIPSHFSPSHQPLAVQANVKLAEAVFGSRAHIHRALRLCAPCQCITLDPVKSARRSKMYSSPTIFKNHIQGRHATASGHFEPGPVLSIKP